MNRWSKWLLRRNIGGRWAPVDILIIVGLLLLLLFLLPRLGLFGLQVKNHFPPLNETGVSNQVILSIEFDNPVVNPEQLTWTVEPPADFLPRWQDNQLILQPIKPLLPATRYLITIDAPLEGVNGQKLRQPIELTFTTRAPRILYLGWDETERVQLFLYEWESGQTTQLTMTTGEVTSYASDLSGDRVVYTVVQPDGYSEIWLLTVAELQHVPIISCEQLGEIGRCDNVVWRPGYDLVIFEQNPSANVGMTNESTLHWLDITTRESALLLDDPALTGHSATFSSDGQWLSYLSPAESGVRVINLETMESQLFPSQAGQLARWQPGTEKLIVGDLHLLENGFALHMYLTSPTDDEIVDLSKGADIEDAGVAWAYQQDLVAFGRKTPRVNQGRQIWIQDLSSGREEQLTDSYEINHGLLSWSYDDSLILFQRFDLSQPATRPAIWILDIAPGNASNLIAEGFLPSWLP